MKAKEPDPARIERMKRVVPKGRIIVEKMPPLKGEVLEPISFRDLGLSERKAA